MLLVLFPSGQYSTGKTSIIKYLLGSDYPGSRVGPEPTTDRLAFILLYIQY
jgi:EH domain-containing protein 1